MKENAKSGTDLFWTGYSYYGSALLNSGCTYINVKKEDWCFQLSILKGSKRFI